MALDRWLWAVVVILAATGCDGDAGGGVVDAVWGQRGLGEGRLQTPRCAAIDGDDRLYLCDKTARIQVFSADGEFLRGWRTPDRVNGNPQGLCIDRQGRLLVADTHYHRVLIYSTAGELLQTVGGRHGNAPGEFGLLTDVAQDSAGNYYVSEYGECDRVQKFSPQWEFLLEFGGHGDAPGQFSRPQSLCVDRQDRLWVADACNHRLQVFDTTGRFLFQWGQMGSGPGEFYYPYDLVGDEAGNIYVVEFGNHRVQKFAGDGQSLGVWGTSGREPGQLANPWALVRDARGRLHVLDTDNHRVQRVIF